MSAAYEAFLRAKLEFARATGFEVSSSEINPLVKQHQRDVIRWAVAGGRRALFESFGLGKSIQQIEIARLVRQRASGRFLQVAPLGVRQEFIRDASLDTPEFRARANELGLDFTLLQKQYAIDFQFVRHTHEVGGDGFYLTNYESIREGKLDVSLFSGVSLDEASILRGFGGTKTFRELMRLFEGTSTFRFVATATPSPNEFIELLAYAAFLGIMDVGQAKTRFFKRNSEKADELTLHPHKTREFWLWVSSWAVFLQRPSDLGYSDEGYELPEMEVHWHEIPSAHTNAGAEPSGQGRLLRNAAIGVVDAAREKRDSLPARIAKMMELRALEPEAHRVIWHDLEVERAALEDVIPSERYGRWLRFKDGNTHAISMFERHYSARPLENRELFIGPGDKMVLLTDDGTALFAWRRERFSQRGETGVCCSVFRNEGPQLSSDLIREAMAAAWLEWPGERLYTFVDPDEILSANPGYCFKQAGWTYCGSTPKGLHVLEAFPGADVPALTREIISQSVWGSQDLEEREAAIAAFSAGEIQELATKPVIAGSGCNFQRHCWWEIFLGIGFKFNDLIQAIHRVNRFLQKHKVRIDLIYTEAERDVRRRLERKWEQHKELTAQMSAIIREYGLATNALHTELQRSFGCERREIAGESFKAVQNDSVIETAAMATDSVHLILTSIPFSTQYEYTPSYNDFGHTDSNEHFWQQMDFLIPELLRVLKPGRVAAVHVKDRIVPGGMTGLGFQTVYPFHSDAISNFTRHGFAFLGMKTIVTDVVRENNQTYRLGWTEQCKDGSRMGAGLPEYLLLFRKPPTDRSNGYADLPVVKDKAKYTRSRWQVDAHGFMRSSGDRLLSAEDLTGVKHDTIFKLFKRYSLNDVYDYEHHVRLSESLERCRECGHIHTGNKVCGAPRWEYCPECHGNNDDCAACDERGSNQICSHCQCAKSGGILPVTFMLLQPQSWHPDVWSDIARMRTLNGAQSAAGREMHLCPMQFDIADRVITQFSMEGETVFDPFMGIGTVPYCAVKLGRRGLGVELSAGYFEDAVHYLEAAEMRTEFATLFDLNAEVSAT
jgi:DNA modification methylase